MRRKATPPSKPTLVAPGITWLPSGQYQARLKMSAEWTWVETFDTKQEAIDARAAKLLQRSAGSRRAPVTITVAELLDLWLAWRTGDLAPPSVERYTTSIGQLGAAFGPIAATRLGVGEIEEWISAQRLAGVGASTINNVVSPLSQAYDMALRRAMPGIVFNPVRIAKKAPVVREQRTAAKLVDVQTLIDALPDDRRIAGYLAWELGLRRAEICGLTMDCIGDKTVTVSRQWTKRPGRGYGFTDLKNHHRRAIPVGNSQILRRIREHVVNQGGLGEHGAIIRGWDGRPVSTAGLTKTWQAALKRTDLPADMDGWHTLRHAYGSHRLDQGENPANIARWMGHTLETFNRHYGRATDAAPTTDLGALSEQARDDTGTSARGKRVADGTTGSAIVVDLAERRSRR